MKPPHDGTHSADTHKDELVARVIPLRRRAEKPQGQQLGDEPDLLQNPSPPQERSVWDPPTGKPTLRRRNTPATPAPVNTSAPTAHAAAGRTRRRSIAAAVAGVAAIGTAAFVLAAAGFLQGPSGSVSRPDGSLAVAGTPLSPARGAPESAVRQPTSPHGSSGSAGHRSQSTSRSRRRLEQSTPVADRTIETAALRTSSTGGSAPVRESAPVRQQSASVSCQAQSACASIEFGIER
jgi:hypothetical protein